MRDIWNPWHGCKKKSEGCRHCYMFYLDKMRNADGSKIYRVKNNFDYPLQRDLKGNYKVKSGEQLRVCLTSDFFLQEADPWRDDAWEIIRERPDVAFLLLTKRPERVAECLPENWNDGWENVLLSVSTENQLRADERLEILSSLPFKHKGVVAAPFIGPISLEKYLKAGFIEQVIAGGENYDGARVLKYAWVKALFEECRSYNVQFCFMETGTKFEKDGKIYTLKSKELQNLMAFKSGLQFAGKGIDWKLHKLQTDLFDEGWHEKHWSKKCSDCSFKLICNGCSNCNACKQH